MPTGLLILAPATLHREAWRALFSDQPDIDLIGATAQAALLNGLIRPGQPTTVLIDLPTSQTDLAQQLKTAAPNCGLLFLVQSYELAQVVALLRAGATGVVARHASVGELARGIIAAAREEIVLPPEVAARALRHLAQADDAGAPKGEQLSARETEALHLLAQGRTNKDIAQSLFLSVRTVETHLRSIFRKLGVHSRTEAALWAVRNGFGNED